MWSDWRLESKLSGRTLLENSITIFLNPSLNILFVSKRITKQKSFKQVSVSAPPPMNCSLFIQKRHNWLVKIKRLSWTFKFGTGSLSWVYNRHPLICCREKSVLKTRCFGSQFIKTLIIIEDIDVLSVLGQSLVRININHSFDYICNQWTKNNRINQKLKNFHLQLTAKIDYITGWFSEKIFRKCFPPELTLFVYIITHCKQLQFCSAWA